MEKKKYLSRNEFDNIAKEYDVDVMKYDSILGLKSAFGDAYVKKFYEEKRKLPNEGRFHNSGNKDSFCEKLKNTLKERVSKGYSWGDSVNFGVDNLIGVEIYSDHIIFKPNFSWKYVDLGLHSNFYDDIIKFLFDKEGAIYSSTSLLARVHHSLDYYQDLSRTLNTELLKKAYVNEAEYEDIKSKYESDYAVLKPFEQYLILRNWDECAQKCVQEELANIEKIKAKISNKTPEECAKFKKKYETSLAIVNSALKHGVHIEDVALVEWNELVSTVAGNNTSESINQDFISRVCSAYVAELESCEKIGTKYMLQKKKKIEQNISVCQKLTEKYGAYCYIDRSVNNSSVAHLNVVINANKVAVFRIPRKNTPPIEELEKYVQLAQALEKIAVNLKKDVDLGTRGWCFEETKGFSIHPYNLDKETKEFYLNLFKFIKGGAAAFSTYVTLALPVGKYIWKISVRKKDAEAVFTSVIEDIKAYVKISRKCEIDIKGVFEERMPKL